MLSLILLSVGVLVGSGLCSMTEAAILSLPYVRAKLLHDHGRKGSRDLLYVKENIDSAISTIVILNNLINIIGSVFIGQLASKIFGSHVLGLVSAILAFTIIIVSEIIPKTIGVYYRVSISLSSARLLRFVMGLLKPFIWFVLFLRPRKEAYRHFSVTEEEIKMILRLGRVAGQVEMDEEKLINRVFKLNDLKAHQMMKPMERVYLLNGKSTLEEAKESIMNSLYSRMPVYEEREDNITGIAQQRILLQAIANDRYGARVTDFTRKPIFIDKDEKADTLLDRFRGFHQHLFIVRDGKKLLGIVTMEDVLEELFGEIYDEKDTSQEVDRKKDLKI